MKTSEENKAIWESYKRNNWSNKMRNKTKKTNTYKLPNFDIPL